MPRCHRDDALHVISLWKRHDFRPGGCPCQGSPGRQAPLRMAMRAMADRETNAHDLAKRLGMTTTTLYMYVNGDGSVKEPGQKLLDATQDA